MKQNYEYYSYFATIASKNLQKSSAGQNDSATYIVRGIYLCIL